MPSSVNPQSNLPDDFEELEFEIEEENWNDYELSDGSRLKARMFLKKIIRDPNKPKQFSFDTIPPIFVVYASVANRGEKNNEPKTYKEYEIHFIKDGYIFRFGGQNLEFMKKEIISNYFPEFEYTDVIEISRN